MLTSITPENCPVTPAHINTKQFFMESFEKTEAEETARLIVKLMQKGNAWRQFRWKELSSNPPPKWAALMRWLIEIQSTDGYGETFEPSVEFVARCWGAAPRTP